MLLTAIASGVGSLFGSGKLKELEHHIEQLHQEITKRDKATDELKIQIQQIQEQHSRQIRNLQRIHNQELEAKDKEISRLSTLLERSPQMVSHVQRDVENGKIMRCYRVYQRHDRKTS